MAHIAQTEFVNCVKAKFPEYFKGTRVLEVGSYNVNGSVRDLFECCYYVGVDVVEGQGVDVVCPGDKYTSDYKFDVVISCEMLEHNPFWRETLRNMVSLLKEDGLLILTCAAPGRPEHGTRRTQDGASPSSKLFGDYYRNLTSAEVSSVLTHASVLSPLTMFCTEFHGKVPAETCSKYPLMNPPGHDQYVNHDLLFVGQKLGEYNSKLFDFGMANLVSLFGE